MPLLGQVQGSRAGEAHVWLIDLIVEHDIQCENGLLLVCGLSRASYSRGKGMGPCMSHQCFQQTPGESLRGMSRGQSLKPKRCRLCCSKPWQCSVA